MTEPAGGSDPTQFVTRAELDGDEWVINGEKWFSSHAHFASFLIVLAVTDPDEPAHRRMSMFVVPADTPGVEIVRNVARLRAPGRPRHPRLHPLPATCGSQPTTCSVAAGTASWWPRPGSAAAGSITPCAPWAWSSGPST